MGEERGKLFTLSLGVHAKLEFSQSELRRRNMEPGRTFLFSFNLITNFVNVLFFICGVGSEIERGPVHAELGFITKKHLCLPTL